MTFLAWLLLAGPGTWLLALTVLLAWLVASVGVTAAVAPALARRRAALPPSAREAVPPTMPPAGPPPRPKTRRDPA